MKKSSPSSNNRPAVFLDRDGVVTEDRDYAFKPEDCRILPGVREAIIDLRAKGLLTVIVTNQSGVARGLFTETNLREFNEHLLRELKPAEIDGVFYCPHHPDGKVATYAISCNCRKPKTGLIDQACSQFGIDRQKSFLVGDKWSDMECAATAGVKGLQVLESGKSNETRHDKAIAFVPSLREAATLIISTL